MALSILKPPDYNRAKVSFDMIDENGFKLAQSIYQIKLNTNLA